MSNPPECDNCGGVRPLSSTSPIISVLMPVASGNSRIYDFCAEECLLEWLELRQRARDEAAHR